MAEACVVTGAAGFIGSHLCAAMLARGRRVVGIDNFDSFYARGLKEANLARVRAEVESSAFEMLEADIRDHHEMRDVFMHVRPSSVFHLAALAGVRPSIEDPARYVSVNVDGLSSVLEAARAADCRTLVFASSSSVYGNSRRLPFSENDPVEAPISPYAATKRSGELLCHAYAHLFGMRIAALRFFTVYGPAQRPDLAISRFMRLIAAGEEIPMFGDGSATRDYSFIDDIIEGICAAESAIGARAAHDSSRLEAFRIWNLGSDSPVPLAELIDTVARVVGRPARVVRRPMQPGDVDHTWADLTRSRAELGYEPRTRLEDGLRRQWEWMRSGSSAITAPV